MGRAVSVTQSEVTLEPGAAIPADFIAIATGSSYAAPFKPAVDRIADFRRASTDTSARLAKATSVAIVGAGAVGTELAGEIAAAQPRKSITLTSSRDCLFPMYPAKMGAQLKRKLEILGVTVVLGQRTQDLQHLGQPSWESVTLTEGRVIEADLIFSAIGSRPQTSLVHGLPGVKAGTAGRVKTDSWLCSFDYPNVFVAGDIADIGDGMIIVATTRRNPWLIKTLTKGTPKYRKAFGFDGARKQPCFGNRCLSTFKRKTPPPIWQGCLNVLVRLTLSRPSNKIRGS